MIRKCNLCNKEYNYFRKDNIFCSQKCCRRSSYIKNCEKEKLNGLIYKKLYRTTEEGHKKIVEYNKNYRQQNKEKRNKKAIQDKLKRPELRILCNTRSRLHQLVNYKKQTNTIDLIGCSPIQLKEYLEKKFKEGMSWDNYGKWHIDHIIPCSSFNLLDLVEQKKCFNYKNLQPLWAEENLRKSNKIIEEVKNE